MTSERLALQAALDLAARGWPVFPCSPNTKQPLTGAGFKDASTDAGIIAAWWRRWPKAMIGIPTGAPIGAFVIDVDPRDGQTPEAVLAQLADAIGCALPPAPIVRTPRGGLHVYFAMPAEALGNRAGVIDQVDVRGDGGYVIVPPSVRAGDKARKEGCDGIAYAYEPDAGLEDFSPAPAPAALVRRILRQDEPDAQPPRAAPSFIRQTADDRTRRYALSALEGEVRDLAQCPRGRRNAQLNIAAYNLGQLLAAGELTQDVVTAALEEAAASCGLLKEDGPRSVRATIASGLNSGRAKPRDLAGLAAPTPARPFPGPPPVDDPGPASRAGGTFHGGGGGRRGGHEDGADGLDPERLAANAQEPQNDTGNARRLMRWFGDDMMFVRDVGQHFWAGTHWETKGGEEEHQRWAQITAERITFEENVIRPSATDQRFIADAEPLLNREESELKAGEKQVRKRGVMALERLAKRCSDRYRFAIASGNSSKIRGMIVEAAPHLTVAPEALDVDPMAVNLRNGTLRFCRAPDPDCPEPGVERLCWSVRLDTPHQRLDRISKVMPVVYDPEAECPRWRAFMDRFQPNPGVQRFLQAWHGYAITGLTGEQLIIFNYGLGANGKSTFMEAIARLMGSYAFMLPAEALTGDTQRRGDQATPEFARLPGARLVRCAELPRGQGFRESTIKLLTGGEPLLVRHLHARFFEFRPMFKAIGSGNDRPKIGGVDEGIWRRMRLVPWEVTIAREERRPMEKVLEEFAAEASGILNWLIAGALDYLENGLVAPQEILLATDTYRADMDPVGEFINACVVPTEGVHVTAREMYTAYVAWCHANSVKPFSEVGFAGIMVQKGRKKEAGRIRKYLDVTLKDVPVDPEVHSRASGGWGV